MASLQSNYSGYSFECGTDEAGRGCLAGPVVAAAVILPADFECAQLNDSKQLSEKERDSLRPIIEKAALAWGIGVVENFEIDELNILNASILAMHRAIEAMGVSPQFIISDGNRFKPFGTIPYQTIVKGDAKFLSIAAASVLAKTHRDELMLQLDEQYPVYDWKKNKAYPTKAHRKAIVEHGASPLHRLSFNLTGGDAFYETKKALQKEKKAAKKQAKSTVNQLLF